MSILKIMNRLRINDFIPPILGKVLNKVAGVIGKKERYFYPFQYLPRDKKAEWILDIGANVGDVTIAALKTYPLCKAICFEPVKGTYAVLNNNLLQFKDRVFIYNEALSDLNGESEINLTSFHGANSIEPQSEFHRRNNPEVQELGKQKIKLSRLDDIASTLPANHIDIMKIDVEGHELKVLEGGKKFIEKNVDTIIIEIAFQREQSWEEQKFISVFTFMKALGFCLVNIYDVCNATNSQTSSNLMISQMDCVFRHKSKLITTVGS